MTDYTKTKVADIQPGVNGDNVAVKIITCKETKEERGRLVAEGTCGDETAIINFRVVGSKNIKYNYKFILISNLIII